MTTLSKSQFELAAELLHSLDFECDCRVWNKDGKNEKVYRKLKAAVRAWDYALTFGWITEAGSVLVADSDMELAREFELKGSKAEWNGDLHKKYLADVSYRAIINRGSKIIEAEGINDLSEAQNILDAYKGVFLPAEKSTKPSYTELVLSGKYFE